MKMEKMLDQSVVIYLTYFNDNTLCTTCTENVLHFLCLYGVNVNPYEANVLNRLFFKYYGHSFILKPY